MEEMQGMRAFWLQKNGEKSKNRYFCMYRTLKNNSMNQISSSQKVVLIGASSGLGLELARIYITAGCVFGLAARRTAPLLILKQLAPQRVFVKELDVTAT